MCCYCHKGKAMFTLFFLLQAAVCGFPEHFNLLSSWTRERWPCPLITPTRFVVVNIRWGLCKRAIQSTFGTKGIYLFFSPENSKKHNRTQNVDKVFLFRLNYYYFLKIKIKVPKTTSIHSCKGMLFLYSICLKP